jgi:hypothetical protein
LDLDLCPIPQIFPGFAYFKKRSISITWNYMKYLPVKYSTKQACLVWMMPNSKLRHGRMDYDNICDENWLLFWI